MEQQAELERQCELKRIQLLEQESAIALHLEREKATATLEFQQQEL